MKIIKPLRQTTLAILSILGVSVLSSCEEYNPFSEQELFNQEYSKNFFAQYGNFPAGQSWDFSDAPRTAPTDPSIFDLGREGVTRAATRAGGHTPEADEEVSLEDAKTAGVLSVPSGTPGAADDPYYYLEPDTYDWLKKNLPEGKINTPKGSPFVFRYESPSTTDQRFAIIPFYQGFGTVHYKLHMVAVDQEKDYIIWDNWPMGTGTPTNPDGSVGTSDFQVNTKDYQAKPESQNWVNVKKADKLDDLFYKQVRSKPMIISGLTGEFYFYLELTSLFSQYGDPGEHQSSKEGMMLALDCPIPEHINNYKTLFGVDNSKTISQVMVIGCEDSKKADWDINDIAFMIVGLTDLPQKIERKYSKRYLIEDLGTTVDFDFNDVVVDVTETVVINTDGTDGEVLAQEAVLRHKCGTVPFQVYFCDEDGDPKFNGGGNPAVFDRMNGHVQGQAEQYTYFDDEGVRVRLVYIKKGDEKDKDKVNYKQLGGAFWEPEKNNIRITVYDDRSDNSHGTIKTGHFNKPGETRAPYIIAVPTTQMWTAESVNFPINDFTVLTNPKGE